MHRAFIVAIAASGWLSACSQPAGAPVAGTQVSEAELPHPRAGLWQWDSRTAGGKQLCLSGQLLSAFTSRPGCPAVSRRRFSDGVYVVKLACADGPVTTTYARASGDFNSAFTVDLKLGDISDHIDARYLGPCPAGHAPDDQPAP